MFFSCFVKEMDVQKIIESLKSESRKPVYLFHGEEPYFIDLLASVVEDEILDESVQGFDQTVVYGHETNVASIVSAAKRYPMMGQLNVVLVKEAQHLRDWDNLLPYLKQPQSQTLLAFAYKKKAAKNLKWVKGIDKVGTLVTTPRVYDNQIPTHIGQIAKTKGLKMSDKSTMLLSEHLGNNLSQIANALDKLSKVMEAQETVEPLHIETHIGISKDYNNFELTNALANRDAARAFKIVNYFGKNPNQHPVLLTTAMLYAYFSKVWKAHYARNASKPIASFLGLPPFLAKDYEMGVRKYSQPQLFKIISILREMDLRAKGVGAQASPSDLFKELIHRILNA